MDQDRRRVLILGGALPYNTIIGGEGVNTTSASALESLLLLSPGDVSYFNLNGNDIEAMIDVSYTIPSATFQNNTDITSFQDLEGKVTQINGSAFEDCVNLVGDLEFINMTTWSGNNQFEGCTGITGFHCDAGVLTGDTFKECSSLVYYTTETNPITNIPGYCFDGCSALTTLDLTNVQVTGTYSIRGANLSGVITANSMVTAGTGTFQDNPITGFVSSSLEVFGSNFFWGTSIVNHDLDTDCPKVHTIGQNCYRQGLLESIVANNVTSVLNSAFYDTDLTSVEMKNPGLTIGTATTNNNVFAIVPLGGSATFHAIQETANAGSVEGDVDYLETSRSWTITYVPASGITYVNESPNIISNCFGFIVADNGIRVAGVAGNAGLDQKNNDVAWDLSSWTDTTAGSGLNTARGMQMIGDSHLFIGEELGNGSINSYSISNYNCAIKTLTGTLNVSGIDSMISDFFVKADGTKIFVLGTSTDKLFAYTMSTAYDLDTATKDTEEYSTGLANPQAVLFNPDGDKVFILDASNDLVREYPLSTAWDISTIGAQTASFDYSTEGSSARDMKWGANGWKLFISKGTSGANNIDTYDVNPPYSL